MDPKHWSEMDEVEDVPNLGLDELPEAEDLRRRLDSGELTPSEANEALQAAARRHAAEHGPDLDTDEEGRITAGGFGSEQGMAEHSTGGRKRKR